MQAVHQLLLAGSFKPPTQQHGATQPSIQPLALKLPVSGLCYQRLQASCSRFAELLQLSQLLADSSSTAVAVQDEQMLDADSGLLATQLEEDSMREGAAADGLSACPAETTFSSSSVLCQLQFWLDSLMTEALADSRLVEVLSQHADSYIHDLLLLSLTALADEHDAITSSSSSGSGSGCSVAAQLPLEQLQQLLLSRQAAELQSMQHPVLWHLLIEQHRQQLRALAGLCNMAAAAEVHGTAHEPAGGDLQHPPGRSITTACSLEALIESLYQSLLYIELAAAASGIAGWAVECTAALQAACLEALVESLYQSLLYIELAAAAASGIAGWAVECTAVLQQATALQEWLPHSSRALLQNLAVLLRLSEASVQQGQLAAAAATAAAGAGAGVDVEVITETQQQKVVLLVQLAGRLLSCKCIVSDAAALQVVFEAARQLLMVPAEQSSTRVSSSSSGDASDSCYSRFAAWLLGLSIQALAAGKAAPAAAAAAAPTPAAACTSTWSTLPPAAVSSNNVLQVVTDSLLGSCCSAAVLPQLVQLLQLSRYAHKQNGWQQLLDNVQLLGRGSQLQHSSCPVWSSLHCSLQALGADPDDSAVALLTLAVQQHWLAGPPFRQQQQPPQQQENATEQAATEHQGLSAAAAAQQGGNSSELKTLLQ
jgi:hypothetical protein